MNLKPQFLQSSEDKSEVIRAVRVRRVFIKSQLEILTEKIHNVMIISDHFDQFTVLMISVYLFPYCYQPS